MLPSKYTNGYKWHISPQGLFQVHCAHAIFLLSFLHLVPFVSSDLSCFSAVGIHFVFILFPWTISCWFGVWWFCPKNHCQVCTWTCWKCGFVLDCSGVLLLTGIGRGGTFLAQALSVSRPGTSRSIWLPTSRGCFGWGWAGWTMRNIVPQFTEFYTKSARHMDYQSISRTTLSGCGVCVWNIWIELNRCRMYNF